MIAECRSNGCQPSSQKEKAPEGNSSSSSGASKNAKNTVAGNAKSASIPAPDAVTAEDAGAAVAGAVINLKPDSVKITISNEAVAWDADDAAAPLIVEVEVPTSHQNLVDNQTPAVTGKSGDAVTEKAGSSENPSPNFKPHFDPREEQERALDDLLASKAKPLWVTEFVILSQRTLVERWRNQLHTRIAIMTAFIVMSVLGSIYWRMGDAPAALTPRTSALLILITMPIFEETFNSGLPLVQSAPVINREYSTKRLYRLSAFFWARTSGEVPVTLIMPLIYASLGFFFFGFLPSNDPAKFLTLLVILTFAPQAAQSLGYLIGSLTQDMNIMIMLILCVQVPMFSLLPMFNPGSTLPWFVAWMRFFSIFNWAGRALAVWAWQDFNLVDWHPSARDRETYARYLKPRPDGQGEYIFISGTEDVLKNIMEIDVDENPHVMAESFRAMSIMIVVFRVLAWARFHYRFVCGDNWRVACGWKGD